MVEAASAHRSLAGAGRAPEAALDRANTNSLAGGKGSLGALAPLLHQRSSVPDLCESATAAIVEREARHSHCFRRPPALDARRARHTLLLRALAARQMPPEVPLGHPAAAPRAPGCAGFSVPLDAVGRQGPVSGGLLMGPDLVPAVVESACEPDIAAVPAFLRLLGSSVLLAHLLAEPRVGLGVAAWALLLLRH